METECTRKTSVCLLEEMITITAVPDKRHHLLSFQVEGVCQKICFDDITRWYRHGNEVESKSFACSIFLSASGAADVSDGEVPRLILLPFAVVGGWHKKARESIVRLAQNIGAAEANHLLEAGEHTKIFFPRTVSIADPDIRALCVKRCALET